MREPLVHIICNRTQDKSVFEAVNIDGKKQERCFMKYINGLIYLTWHDDDNEVFRTRIRHEYWCDVVIC